MEQGHNRFYPPAHTDTHKVEASTHACWVCADLLLQPLGVKRQRRDVQLVISSLLLKDPELLEPVQGGTKVAADGGVHPLLRGRDTRWGKPSGVLPGLIAIHCSSAPVPPAAPPPTIVSLVAMEMWGRDPVVAPPRWAWGTMQQAWGKHLWRRVPPLPLPAPLAVHGVGLHRRRWLHKGVGWWSHLGWNRGGGPSVGSTRGLPGVPSAPPLLCWCEPVVPCIHNNLQPRLEVVIFTMRESTGAQQGKALHRKDRHASCVVTGVQTQAH